MGRAPRREAAVYDSAPRQPLSVAATGSLDAPAIRTVETSFLGADNW